MLLALTGCSVVTPPPLVAAHDLAQPKPEGTTSVTFVAGIASGAFVDTGKGFLVRIAHQVDDKVELGIDLAAGWRSGSRTEDQARAEQAYQKCSEHESAPRSDMPLLFAGCRMADVPAPPDWLIAVRGFSRINPSLDHPSVATVTGIGFGAGEGGLRYLTVDAAARFSHQGDTASAYGGPQLALSVPIARGRPIAYGRRPATTFYAGALGGGMLGDGEPARGSLEAGLLWGFSPVDDVALAFASLAGAFRGD
jgi:hypothetical protein